MLLSDNSSKLLTQVKVVHQDASKTAFSKLRAKIKLAENKSDGGAPKYLAGFASPSSPSCSVFF